MLDDRDNLVGRQGVWKEVNKDSLFDSKAKHVDYEAEETRQRISKAIQVFLDMTPFDFDDQMFLAATNHLTGAEFAKALYRVYLRRGAEDANVGFHITTYRHRVQTIEKCRRSAEFQRLWAKQIEARVKKNPLLYFLNKLSNQA